MHLIISDCTDRSSVFLPLFFYFIRCLAKRKLLNEKAETSIKGVEVSQRNEEQMLLEESPSDGHVLSGDVMLISDSWKPRFRMLVLKPRRYVSFLKRFLMDNENIYIYPIFLAPQWVNPFTSFPRAISHKL